MAIHKLYRNGRLFDEMDSESHATIQIAASFADDMPGDKFELKDEAGETIYEALVTVGKPLTAAMRRQAEGRAKRSSPPARKPKPKLLGSSDTREGIEAIVNRYYYSTNYRVTEANEIAHADGRAVPKNVRVVKAGFRFRFELLPDTTKGNQMSNLTPEAKAEIDAMTYEQLLRKWRFATLGNPMFQGERGSYFADRMSELRRKIGHDAAVQASKNVGWGP